jgi:hypothetical protein
MPKLIRLYILCIVTGFGLAALFLGFLIWQNIAGIGGLVLGSQSGPVAGLMLFVFHGILFAGVEFAVTIMGMAESDGGPRGGHTLRLRPVRIRARSR